VSGESKVVPGCRARHSLHVVIDATAGEGRELDERARLIPLLTGKRAIHGAATAYVCRRRTCDLPTPDPAVFAGQLAKIELLFQGASIAPLPVRAAAGSAR
jgi:uncharacterized protein YyaL (SSP411 family)